LTASCHRTSNSIHFHPRRRKWRRNFAYGFAALIVIGNLSFPIAWVTKALTYKAG